MDTEGGFFVVTGWLRANPETNQVCGKHEVNRRRVGFFFFARSNNMYTILTCNLLLVI